MGEHEHSHSKVSEDGGVGRRTFEEQPEHSLAKVLKMGCGAKYFQATTRRAFPAQSLEDGVWARKAFCGGNEMSVHFHWP